MLKSTRARLAVTVVVGAVLLTSCSTTKTLKVDEVQNAISTGLTEQIGSGTYAVTCPETIEVKIGGTFDCQVKADTGETAVVTGTMTDEEGHFDWKVSQANGGASPSPAAS